MSQLRLACVATAVWASATCAQALNAPAKASEHEGAAQVFTCKSALPGQNRIVAADAPQTVIVSLTLKDKKAIELKVLHVDDNGAKSSPADETKSWRLVTSPGDRDYSWYAMSRQHPNLLMHGRLFEQGSARGGENRWLYNEEQFEYGVKTVDYQSACSKDG